MITKKFDELLDKFADATCIEDRRIKVKLKEIVACLEECDTFEHEFTFEIVDKFCEAISLIELRNELEREALIFKHEGELERAKEEAAELLASCSEPDSLRNAQLPYEFSEDLLSDFQNHFLERKSVSTMTDYAARIKTFAYSEQYLGEMLSSRVLGVTKTDIDPVLFTYKHIELILAKFNTKDKQGESVKQRLNIRSALRMLNEFKCETARR